MYRPTAILSHLLCAALFVALITIVLKPDTTMAYAKGIIIDILRGEPVSEEEMLEDLAGVRIIYIGEFHTVARHHYVQTRIMRALSEKGLKLALGMEMFGVAQQPVLDKWQKGNESLSQLMHELGTFWSNLRDYEDLLFTARKLDIPILGLNASDRLVRKLARKGMEGLTKEERKDIPEGTDKINPDNDRLLRIRLKVHRAFKDKSLDRIVLAQALRDETMARTVARFLDSPQGRDRIVIVAAGSGHLNYGFGIPERAHRLTSLPYRIVLPTESGELVLSEEEKRQSQPVIVTHEDLRFIRSPIADYLHVAPLKETRSPDPEPESRPDLTTLLTR